MTSYMSFNHSPTARAVRNGYVILFERVAIPGDVIKQRLKTMPGFKVTWRYSGTEVEPKATYRETKFKNTFVRNYSNNKCKSKCISITRTVYNILTKNIGMKIFIDLPTCLNLTTLLLTRFRVQ